MLSQKFFRAMNLLGPLRCPGRMLSRSVAEPMVELPEKVDLDWDNLKFAYQPTDSIVVHEWTRKNGWNAGELRTEASLTLSPMSPALHYGQQAFEGLKAFETANGDIGIFHPNNANSDRINASCDRMLMPRIPTDMFNDAVLRAVKDNARWVPPYRKGSLYIRPFIIGTGCQLGLAPASEYKFVVCVMPVGNYYACSNNNGLNALVMTDFDRVAARGTGAVKVGGNYGADLLPSSLCRSAGYDTTLYLDSLTQTQIEEFSVSNLAAITKDGGYVTPQSRSILPSVTNRVLMQLATDSGLSVERRPVNVTELESFREVAAIGTAVVVNPIQSITHGKTRYEFDQPSTLLSLKEKLIDIQFGDAPDTHDWLMSVRLD